MSREHLSSFFSFEREKTRTRLAAQRQQLRYKFEVAPPRNLHVYQRDNLLTLYHDLVEGQEPITATARNWKQEMDIYETSVVHVFQATLTRPPSYAYISAEFLLQYGYDNFLKQNRITPTRFDSQGHDFGEGLFYLGDRIRSVALAHKITDKQEDYIAELARLEDRRNQAVIIKDLHQDLATLEEEPTGVKLVEQIVTRTEQLIVSSDPTLFRPVELFGAHRYPDYAVAGLRTGAELYKDLQYLLPDDLKPKIKQ